MVWGVVARSLWRHTKHPDCDRSGRVFFFLWWTLANSEHNDARPTESLAPTPVATIATYPGPDYGLERTGLLPRLAETP